MSEEAKKNKPDLLAYSVRNFGTGDNERSTWRQIGVAWFHQDKQGFDVVLDALPVSGRVVLRAPKEKDEKPA